jgi:hypothetical protein
MQGSRTLAQRHKTRIILNRSCPVFTQLEVGQTGQLSMKGAIEEERLESQSDGTELFVKTVKILKAELLNAPDKV